MSKEALRYNRGKLRFNLIPWEWLQELASVFTEGAWKYTDHNWKNSINGPKHHSFRNGCLDSAYRHINKYRAGEVYDAEETFNDRGEVYKGPKTLHLFKAIWNLGAIAYYDMKWRPTNDPEEDKDDSKVKHDYHQLSRKSKKFYNIWN